MSYPEIPKATGGNKSLVNWLNVFRDAFMRGRIAPGQPGYKYGPEGVIPPFRAQEPGIQSPGYILDASEYAPTETAKITFQASQLRVFTTAFNGTEVAISNRILDHEVEAEDLIYYKHQGNSGEISIESEPPDDGERIVLDSGSWSHTWHLLGKVWDIGTDPNLYNFYGPQLAEDLKIQVMSAGFLQAVDTCFRGTANVEILIPGGGPGAFTI